MATLKGTIWDTGLDPAHFCKVAARLQSDGILGLKVLRLDTNTLAS